MEKEKIDEISDSLDEPMLHPTDMESSVIGYAKVKDKNFQDKHVFCCSVKKIIENLEEQGMSYEEAIEYFDFNIECAYVGEYTPIFIYED